MANFESFIGINFWTALFVLLNTLAIFFAARKFLFKPVHKMITDRQSEIDGMYADAGKAKIVTLADRWATWIVVIALSAAFLTLLFTGEIIRSVTILVVFCPCALVLATPTAIMAAIGNVTKHGFLVREGDALERLAKVDRITFDKTGTLTYGLPEVIEVRTLSKFTVDEIYHLAASAETLSEHPLGKAVVRCFSGVPSPACQFHMEPGEGVSAIVDGHEILAGNRRHLAKAGVSVDNSSDTESYIREGCTIIYISIDRQLAGYLVLSDTLREESVQMIHSLMDLDITPVLLTGDNYSAASAIAQKVGIREFSSECLPEDKLSRIDEMQQSGNPICMIGDGINDAPALKKAHVGIAMGGAGSDIAVDASDIVLVEDEIKELPHLVALSRHMMTTIKVNLVFSMALNFLAIILAITGILGPVIGALVHNMGSVLVITNSSLLLRWRRK